MAKFTTKNIEFKDDQKAIFGTGDDASIFWDGALNDLRITTTLSGVTPTQSYHLTTKQYVDDDISTINVYDDSTVVSGSPFESLNFIDCTVSGNGTTVDITPSLIFGSEFQEMSDDTMSSTTSDTYQQKLRLTTGSLPSGKHRIGWYYEWSYDAAVSDFMGRIQIDDAITIMEHQEEPSDSGSDQWHNAGGFYYYIGSGPVDIDLDYSASVGGNTALIRKARLEIWMIALPPGSGDRGVFGGGYISAGSNVIDYITISTPGNANDFGDLTTTRSQLAATSNGAFDRGIFAGGSGPINTMDYITISSTGNGTSFGDLTVARYGLAATSNGTSNRGVFAGGNSPAINTIDYVIISSTGDATDFGDLTVVRFRLAATSNGTGDRGVFGGGRTPTTNTIDYITISTTGNASDFGDLTVARNGLAATSNGTNDRGIFGGGDSGSYENTIDYITITSLGNATDFGDLTVVRSRVGSTSNGTNDRGVFGGGFSPTTNTIDYITMTSLGNATDFGDLTVSRYNLGGISNA